MTKYSALLRQISELEARVGQKDCEHLVIIVNEGEDPKPAQAKALAEWMAAHPKAKKRDVGDFSWIVWTVVHRPPPGPTRRCPVRRRRVRMCSARRMRRPGSDLGRAGSSTRHSAGLRPRPLQPQPHSPTRPL